MKAKSLLAAFALICALCLSASCRKKTQVVLSAQPLDANVIATVQGRTISREFFQRKLNERIGPGGAPFSETKKEAVLEEMVRHEAVYARAKAARFDERPEIATLIQNLIVSRYIEQQRETAEPRITNEKIQEYYTTHRTEFLTPASAKGAIIFFRASPKMVPEKREELRRHAKLVLMEAQETRNEADFTRLVQLHSEHQATRYRSGDLGWMTRAQCEAALGAEVSDALFALKKSGDFSPLLETTDGFYILKLQEAKEARVRPLTEVEEVIRYQLSRREKSRREEEFFAGMKQGLDIQINRALLESISVPKPNRNPPALPGSQIAQGSTTR